MALKKLSHTLFLLTFLFNTAICGEKNSTPYYSVGELGKKWEFGSDHLPVGASINNRHFVSWNILNKNYLHWIETNSQGLKNSAILRDNVQSAPGSFLTVREEKIVDEIVRMAEHSTHPRSVIALEETHQDVFDALKKKLPASYVPVTTYPHDIAHGDVFFYDSGVFDFVDYIGGEYVGSHNTWMMLTLKDKNSGISYSFLQSHVPGGENSKEFRLQLAEKCLSYLDGNTVTLVMGDQNRSPDYFIEDLRQAGKNQGKGTTLFRSLAIPYPTHVNTLREASWIDNILLADPLGQARKVYLSSTADEYFEELSPILALLSDHFPQDKEIKKARTSLAANPRTCRLFDDLISEMKVFSLTSSNLDLSLFLKAVSYASKKGDDDSLLQGLQLVSKLWNPAKIHSTNILTAALLQGGPCREIESLFGSRVAETIKEVEFGSSEVTIQMVLELSQDAKLILLAKQLLLLESDAADSLAKERGKLLLNLYEGTHEVLENRLREALLD